MILFSEIQNTFLLGVEQKQPQASNSWQVRIQGNTVSKVFFNAQHACNVFTALSLYDIELFYLLEFV